jgi:hypothetical protein
MNRHLAFGPSFETAAERPPQDEVSSNVDKHSDLILRSGAAAPRLEGWAKERA